MKKLGRISAVAGLIILLSVPLTMFLNDWRLGLVAVVKIVLGALALLLWPILDAAGLIAAFRRRSFFFSMIELLSALLALAAVVIVNYLAYSFPWRADLTREKVFTLSDQTRALISGLDDDIELLAFYGPGEPEYEPLYECFDRYNRLSDRFSARLIDPIRRQDLVKRYKISAGGPRLVLLYHNRRARAKIARRLRGCPEQAIANAILSLTSDDGKIDIHPRYRKASLLMLDRSQIELIAVVSTDLLPLLILVFGLCVWLARRWS